MKFATLLILFLNINTVISQTVDSLYFDIINYKDTISSEKEGRVELLLRNESTNSILLSNYPKIYLKIQELAKDEKDYVNLNELTNVLSTQRISQFKIDTLLSKESKKFSFSIFEGYIKRPGLYKLKIVLELKGFNKNISDVETKWFYVFIKRIKGLIE